MLFSTVSLLVLAPSLAHCLPSYQEKPPRNQHLVRAGYPDKAQHVKKKAERAAAVIEGFNHAWNGYYQYAYPADELHPVSNTPGNSRNGWGASTVDALSTAIIMGQTDIVDIIIGHIATIDFSYTNETCSLFETTIRYLAGMLAGYDLLTGPFANTTSNTTAINTLLTQSVNLANTLKFAFDTPSGVPYNDLNITAQTPVDSGNELAQIGTLVLEWTRLSDLTGDATFANLSQKGESYLLNPQPAWAEPFPGLVGTGVNVTTGLFTDATGGWQGGEDSFYEYLIKIFIYDPNRFSEYRDRWLLAVDSSIRYLASHPAPSADHSFKHLTWLAEFQNTTLIENSEHLMCFDGGNFILGGIVLQNSTIADFGLQLVDSCHKTYTSTVTGIGPEQFSWNASAVPANQTAFFAEHGFYITSSLYDLRPEVLESYYYAYRYTGDAKYQDWAWDAFVAINATCRTPSGFTEVSDVNAPGGGKPDDLQESFLFAEVMKYAYIIHAGDAEWQVQNSTTQGWVINTEAHPFKVVGPPA